jgi:hypothetical protein
MRKSKQPVPDAGSEQILVQNRDLLAAIGGAHAPIIFADEAATAGRGQDNITNITLQAERHQVLPSGMVSDQVAVAHLRLTPRAVRNLKIVLAQLDERDKHARKMAN